ncbi:MAG: caspase family protein [Thermodesulfovibrionales bacterium]|nr:caspase family protein [Thermodesulfovibrionales bacterium]
MFDEVESSIGLFNVFAFFSPDGKNAFSVVKTTLTAPIVIKKWDVETGKEIKIFKTPLYSPITESNISYNGKYILVGNMEGEIIVFNVETGTHIKTFKAHSFVTVNSLPFIGWLFTPGATVKSIAFSPDNKYVLSGGYDKIIKLWDLESMKEIRIFKGHTSGILSIAFSPDGKYAVSGSWDTTLKLWDIATGREIRTFSGHADGIYSVAFSPDGKFALSGSWDATVKLWDIATGKEIKTFIGHSKGYELTNWVTAPGVLSVAFTHNGKYAVSAGDASVRIWDIATGKELAMFIAFKDGEWIVITSEGYYNASEKGAQYLSVKVENKKYDMNLFYDVFYRPDIVAAKLRGEDIKDLITITMQDAIKSPPPVVEISPITASPTSPKAKVCYQAKSTGGGIGEVRLFHNGKLIESDGYYKETAKTSDKMQLAQINSKTIYEDMRSVKIKEKAELSPVTTKSKGDVFNDCKEIEAVSGENEISVTAFNKDNTVQGYMQTAKFTSAIKPEEPHLYILSIGIDQYKDSTINLKYAVKDSKDIKERILKQAETLYKPQHIHNITITDKEATKTNIISRINELSSKIKPTDSFILFVAGHGILLQNQYYMLTNEYDGTVNEGTMISSNEIVEISKKIKSLSQLFIFDTCHAGGVDYIVSGLYDARMSVLAKKMGLHIYASANSKEQAMDGYQGNGLFTYTLLDGLNNNKNADKNKDNKISLTELGEYSKQTTTDISKKIGHSQTPLIINFGKDNAVYNLR